MEIIDQLFWYCITCSIGALCGIFWILWLDRCKHDWNHLDILHKQNGNKRSQVYVSQCKKCCKLKTQEVK